MIADANILIGASTSSAQVDRVVLEAIKVAGKKRNADRESAAGVDMDKKTGIIYADMYLHVLLDTIHDEDCISREFNVGDQPFGPDEAVSVLLKCKLLLLRNVFGKISLTEYRNNFINYINAINLVRISSDWWTRNR